MKKPGAVRAFVSVLVLLGASSLLSLGLGEIIVRSVADKDLDGNTWVGWRRIKPYRMPVRTVEEAARLLGDPRAKFVYDPDLGWLPKPGLQAAPYFHDRRGLRVGEETEGNMMPSSVRGPTIGLFGDSFIYGAEVSFEDSIGGRLQETLKTGGSSAMVSNYGASGYGIDQAFLRWRKQGTAESCVILALPKVDVARNLSLVKATYLGYLIRLTPEHTLPFTKPRFLLEGGRLRLVNQPSLSSEGLVKVLANPESWPSFQYEGLYTPSDYRETWLRKSQLVSLLVDVWERNRWTYAPGSVFWADDDRILFGGSPARELLLKILEDFSTEVAARGAHFSILYVPDISEVRAELEGRVRGAHYQAFWRTLKASYSVIDPAHMLVAAAKQHSPEVLFAPGFHYSGRGAALIAQAIQVALPAHCPVTTHLVTAGPPLPQ